MRIDLRLQTSQWTSLSHTTSDATTCHREFGNGVFLRSDYPCCAPDDAATLRTHPGRLAAITITDDQVKLSVDRLRSWPLFWSLEDSGTRLVVSDDPQAMLEAMSSPALHQAALHELADAGFVTGSRTLLSGVHQVPQGTIVTVNRQTGYWDEQEYSFFRYHQSEVTDAEEFTESFLTALHTSMTRLLERTDGRRLIIPLSGGLDSRLLVAWLSLHNELYRDRVLAFTYGIPGAREVEVSRDVAAQVNLEWHAVPYERHALLRHWHSADTAKFLSSAHAWSALPHVQDWYALSELRRNGIIHEGDIVLPGHTIVGNMHDLELLDNIPLSHAHAAHAVVWYHHNLQGRPYRAWVDPWVAPPLRDAFRLAKFDGHSLSVRSFIEGYNLRERQTKYINNSVRAYEHLGLDWALPMLDYEVWDAWSMGSAHLTATRTVYQAMIDRLWAQATRSGGAHKAYYEVTQVSASTRSQLKNILSATHLLPAAERTFSAWSSLHSSMAFDALFTDVSRPRAAAELMYGRKTLGFWTRAFLSDTWCSNARIFGDLPLSHDHRL